MNVGYTSGWNIWPLASGEWGKEGMGLGERGPLNSGIEATEAEAREAAQRALEGMLSDAAAAEQSRRELPDSDARGKEWDPQA